MAGEHDEDALFDRLAKSLEAVRQDAELARSGGAEGLAASLARAEGEVRSVAVGLEALRQRFEQQHAATARLEAAAAKHETDLQAVRQTVEALSLRLREQAEARARPPARRAGRAVGSVVLVLVLLVLAGGAGAWMTSGRHPTVDALVHRFVVRVSELTGINLTWLEPARSAPTMAQATPSPEPAAPPQASPATEPAAPAAATPPASAAQAPPAPTPSAAPPPPAETAAAATPAPTEPSAVAPPPAQAPAAAAPPPAQTAAASPPGPVTPAAPPPTQSATPGSAATALEQPPRVPHAVRQIVLRATADSWVEVRQKGGRVLLRRIMKEGETWPVPNEPDLLLGSGNAGALVLEVNGAPTRLPGLKPGVVHDVPLDLDSR